MKGRILVINTGSTSSKIAVYDAGEMLFEKNLTHTAEEIAQTIAPQFEETDSKDAAMIIERYQSQDTWKDNLVFEEEAFTLLQDILRDAGQLTETVPYEELVNTSYAKSAAKVE